MSQNENADDFEKLHYHRKPSNKCATSSVVANCNHSEPSKAIITKYETETVQLTCYTKLKEEVEWRVQNSHEQQNFKRIFSTDGLVESFEKTGRYTINVGSGFYNLTISHVRAAEAGEYVCVENEGYGSAISTVHLIVTGEWINSLVVCYFFFTF